ncbi:OmpA family protein [Kistimonas asteriae]|uniref:OmpA family protein n=1 Tax=Kistimonas asteriae TaxID=517724 RepID=UPI001BA7F1BB|nr:OmpA family protein [Kistimonas asteriae]
MELAKIGKGLVAALMATYLVGCASSGGSSSGQEMAGETDQSVTEVVTTPIVDPAVQAVIDSGKVQATPEQITEMLTRDVYNFDFDSDRLSPEDYLALDVQAAYLTSEAGKNVNLIIRGHTDERGTRTYNLALGERRANAVKNYLMLKGITSDRVEVISYGFEKPLDPAHTDAAWNKNRRAEIDSANGSL